MFFAEIWRERFPIITLKNGVGEFLFFASFKSYDHFKEENACFIKPQSLTPVKTKPDKQSKWSDTVS